MEKEQQKYEAALRLIASEQFTQEMAINYLFQWRKNNILLQELLVRIQRFLKGGSYNILPTAIFIMSIEPNPIIQRFCQRLSKQSLSCYLLLRWSYSTYLQERDLARNKLDNCIFARNIPSDVDMSDLARQIKKKEMMLNYTISLNDYYERLFAIPQKLKKYQKQARNEKLRQRLLKMHDKFLANNKDRPAILIPLQQSSCMAISVSIDHCFTFTTKERVPFKIVYQTISEADLEGQKGQKQDQKERIKQKQSLILPQSYFGSEWRHQKLKIASLSPCKHYPSYRIQSFMIKSGDDLRQQHMAMQLITMVKDICKKQNVKIWLRTYTVIPFDKDSGLIQFVQDTRTVSYLKEKSKASSLRQVYKQLFGDNWEVSVSNFIQSLAGYSIVQYLFQIKDRHNNNILIDNQGHIIHIDFSFIMSSSPGNFGFEKAPFKITKDYIELMDGVDSDIFLHFKLLFFFALKFIRKYKREIMQRVQIMAHCRDMKCFSKYEREQFESRFHEGTTDQQLMKRVEEIIKSAINSYSTGQYDIYQWFTNYIYN